MKIGFFTDTYFPQLNGVTIAVHEFANELRKEGHQVTIIAPKLGKFVDHETDVLRISSVKILSSEPEVMFPLLLPEVSMRKIFSQDYDIIHAHGNGAFSFLGYQVAKQKNIPFVMTLHTLHNKYSHYIFNGKLIKPRMIATGLRLFGNLCDGVIVPSKKMKREVLRFGITKPLMIIPNFIDTQRFANGKKGYLRKMFHLTKDTPILLTVGRLGKEKNFAFLIKMFAQLAKKEKSSHLVIVGQGTEAPALKGLVASLQMDDRIHFTGRIAADSMPDVYADASLFLFSSTTETQGLCVLEAAAAGLPLIVAKDLAYQGLVQDEVDGYLLPLNQKIFVRKIISLLKNKEKLGQFGKAAAKVAQDASQPGKITNDLLAFYQEIHRSYHGASIFKNRNSRTYLFNFLRVTERIQRLLNA